ncbi:MAG: hypothetical protein REI45_15550, partial [Propionicimonas sp.]|nr:hypothetical protein [Propionicimonas sp.]
MASVTGAAAWFPPDGHRARLVSGSGVAAVEWSRPTPFALAQSAPDAFWTWAQVSSVGWDTAGYLRARGSLLDAAAAVVGRRDTVWVLGDDGARLVLDETPQETVIFEPGLPAVPPDLAPGQEWTATGELAQRPSGGEWAVYTYQATQRAVAPADPALARADCVSVATDLGFDGGTRASEQTWCPGSGIVAGREGDTAWSPTGAGPVPPAPRPRPFDWARADQLTFATRVLNQTGPGVTHVSPVSPPGILPAGEVVFTSQLIPDVLALDPADDPAPVVWSGR